MKFISRKNEFLQAEDEALQRALTAIGLQLEGYAKEEITRQKAVDTGRLRNSVTYATATTHGSTESTPLSTPERDTVYVGTNVEYAPYIELGAKGRPARPYLAPSVKNHVNEYKGILRNELRG